MLILEEISNKRRPKDKVSLVVKKCQVSKGKCYKNSFYTLLNTMEECGNDDT